MRENLSKWEIFQMFLELYKGDKIEKETLILLMAALDEIVRREE